MDVRSQEELETVDLTQARLVYASSHFKGLATGGNVSQAFVRISHASGYPYNLILILVIFHIASVKFVILFHRHWLGNELAIIQYCVLTTKW